VLPTLGSGIDEASVTNWRIRRIECRLAVIKKNEFRFAGQKHCKRHAYGGCDRDRVLKCCGGFTTVNRRGVSTPIGRKSWNLPATVGSLYRAAEPWRNGQAEGQINRLKRLKRAMYGRSSAELMRAPMIPLFGFTEHEK
jgi:hypothetical protein